MAEAGIGGIQPLDQRNDVIFEMANCEVAAARLLDHFDLVGQRLHQRFQHGWHRGAALRAFGECVRERGDALLETVERIVAAGRQRHGIDLFGQFMHLGRQPADGVVRGDMGRHVAQRGDGLLKLMQRGRVFLHDDLVDLVRETGHRLVEADQIFRRREAA